MPTSDAPRCGAAYRSSERKDSNANSGRKLGFLDLPGELRNKIYALALVRNDSVKLSKSQVTPDDQRRFTLRRAHPALLETSKVIAKEAAPVFYESNLFQFRGGALNLEAVRTFRVLAGKSTKKLRRISMRRSIQIGDLKEPVKVSLTASIDQLTKHIVLVRPPYERKVYVPGRVKLKSSFVEPCRCEVDKLALNFSSHRTNGDDLLDFLEAYCQLLNMESKETMLDICPVCDTIRRD